MPLDRSNSVQGTGTLINKSAQSINSFIQAYGVVDPWRAKNPTLKKFSFFSPPHKSFSQIDYFLLDSKLLPMVTAVDYETIVISDHSPVVMKMCFPGYTMPQRIWRLNTRLLTEQKFIEFINMHIDIFFETNSSPDISYSILWETFKVYIRGQIISYSASDRKKKLERISEISNRLKIIDQSQSSSASEALWKERALLQTEYDLIMNEKAIEMQLHLKQQHFEHGERAGRMLSHQLKQNAAAGYISALKNEKGEIITDQKNINREFVSFYKELYSIIVIHHL